MLHHAERSLICTDVRLLQSLNASCPMDFRELPIVIDSIPLPLNASFPIIVTELGMVTDVRLLQPENTLSPMLVTEFGIVTEVSPVDL